MIEARGLTIRLGGRVVLDGVDLRLERREVVALIGPPEAGKTVLVKALAGLVELQRGEVRRDGAVVVPGAEAAAFRGHIGMSFQNDALFDALSVYDNIAFPLRRRRVPEAEIEARVTASLEDVGLLAAARRLPSEISGGMKKRVGIARATVIQPEIGLFDEPTAGLDPVTSRRILDLILGLTSRLGMCTLVISSDLDTLLPVASRAVMLHEGRVLFDGRTEDLQRSSRPEVVQFASGADEGPL